MNNKHLKRLLRVIIKTFLTIMVLILIAVLSYYVTTLYYNSPSVKNGNSNIIEKIKSNYKVEDISKNAIISIKDDAIQNIMIEIFNKNTNNVDYLTIPANTQFDLSADLYQKLYTLEIDIPQIIIFSDLNKYFQGDELYQYTSLILGDLLETKISYYTVVSPDTFKNLFEDVQKYRSYKSAINDEDAGAITELYIMNIYTKDALNEIKNILGNKEGIQTYLEELYNGINSNLTLKNRLKYLDYYAQVREEQIYFHKIYGTDKKSTFVADLLQTRNLIEEIQNNDTYTLAQFDGGQSDVVIISSKDKVISIYNGANVSGLAKNFRDKLTSEGFTISSINNYDGGTLTNTKIVIKENGFGLDLLSYFSNAEIEVGEVPEGVDIMIILGSNDGK